MGSEVMSIELSQVRTGLMQAHRTTRREAQRHRRLVRRCRVKNHEDLDDLERRYVDSSFLRPIEDPADTGDASPSSFAATSPSPTPVALGSLSARSARPKD